MSILLKDIPIPKEPTPITIYPDGRWYDYTDGTHGTWTKLPKKYGRLIDADELMNESLKDGAYGYVDTKQIYDAPTVIEAEGEE